MASQNISENPISKPQQHSLSLQQQRRQWSEEFYCLLRYTNQILDAVGPTGVSEVGDLLNAFRRKSMNFETLMQGMELLFGEHHELWPDFQRHLRLLLDKESKQQLRGLWQMWFDWFAYLREVQEALREKLSEFHYLVGYYLSKRIKLEEFREGVRQLLGGHYKLWSDFQPWLRKMRWKELSEMQRREWAKQAEQHRSQRHQQQQKPSPWCGGIIYMLAAREVLGPSFSKFQGFMEAYIRKRISSEELLKAVKEMFGGYTTLWIPFQRYFQGCATHSPLHQQLQLQEKLWNWFDGLTYVTRVKIELGPRFVDFQLHFKDYMMKRIDFKTFRERMQQLLGGHHELWSPFENYLQIGVSELQRAAAAAAEMARNAERVAKEKGPTRGSEEGN